MSDFVSIRMCARIDRNVPGPNFGPADVISSMRLFAALREINGA